MARHSFESWAGRYGPLALVLIDDSTAASITNQRWSLSPADDVASPDGSPMTLHALALPVD